MSMQSDMHLELSEVLTASQDHAAKLQGQAQVEERYGTMCETERLDRARHEVAAALRRAAEAYDAYAAEVRAEMRRWER